MREVDDVGTYEALLDRIAPLGLAYLHVLIEPTQPAFAVVRSLWDGTLVLNTAARDRDRLLPSWRRSRTGASSAPPRSAAPSWPTPT